MDGEGTTVARVGLVCELGNGYGHLTRLLPLALALRDRGHEPLFIVNDLTRADTVLAPHGLAALPCPPWRHAVAGLPPMRTYTDILLRHGFVDVAGLRGLARAWQQLMAVAQPALMVVDHSPVALFATRGGKVPRLRFGDGFCCPPLETPMPPFAWWAGGAEPFDTIAERNVVHVANLAAADLGLPRTDSVAQMLQAEAEFLCTFAELDHYGARDDGCYEGAVLDLAPAPGNGPNLPWPAGDAPCAFIYLRPDYPHLDALLAAVALDGWRAVVHVPGLPSARANALSGDRVQLSPSPLPMDVVARRCQAAITHGGYGTTHALLLAGLPQLLLPRQMEQSMTSHRLQALGAGLALELSADTPDFTPLLTRLRTDAALAEAARAFAARQAARDPAATVDALVQRCESLM